MPRRNSSRVNPVRLGRHPALSLDQLREEGFEPFTGAESAVEFDWVAFAQMLGLDNDGCAFLERKHLGETQAELGWAPKHAEAVRARVARRLKKAKLTGLKRSQFEIPLRGGNSRHLVFKDQLNCGRAWTLSELTASFPQIMGGEFPSEAEMCEAWRRHEERIRDFFYSSRTKSRCLRGSIGSAKHMQHTVVRLELKNLTDQGTFEGDLAVYGNVDYGDDLIEPGAFTKTLTENRGVVPMFLNHRVNEIQQKVGALYLTDSPRALKARGILNLELPSAQEARSVMQFDIQHGLKTAMSIGYDAVKKTVKDGVRHLHEIKLWEGSLVGIGMNSEANVTAAKKLDIATVAAQMDELMRMIRQATAQFRSR